MKSLASNKTTEDVKICTQDLNFQQHELKLSLFKQTFYFLRNIFKKDTVLFIYPFLYSPFNSRFWRIRFTLFKLFSYRKQLITYVVDLPVEQRKALKIPTAQREITREKSLFRLCDDIIVFGSEMKEYLSTRYKINEDVFSEYTFLDHLYEGKLKNKNSMDNIHIVYVGSAEKRYFENVILNLPKHPKVVYHFYSDAEWIIEYHRQDIIYHGTVDANILPTEISEYHFGLITRDIEDLPMNELYDYGSTSKFSLYMVANLPVIVPKVYKYLAKVVPKYEVGIVFDTYEEIVEKSVNLNNYKDLEKNTIQLGKKISQGRMLKEALNKIIS